jgi:hypothetical protein
VLRQAGQYGPDEDTTIVLHPSHRPLIGSRDPKCLRGVTDDDGPRLIKRTEVQ